MSGEANNAVIEMDRANKNTDILDQAGTMKMAQLRDEFMKRKLRSSGNMFRFIYYDTPSSTPHYTLVSLTSHSHTHARTLHSKPKDSRHRLEGSRGLVVKRNLTGQQRYTLNVLNITLLKKI